MCALAIRIPMKRLDQMAEKLRIQISLTLPQTNLIVKAPFDLKSIGYFNSFFATEKQEGMLELLREEIDFDEYMADGVIQGHFPLHKRKYIDKTIQIFD